ncbi:hypothetical protein F4823DRAFT_315796 [Ustulina deusta]|nr:hypothetical protein F4823DRAFT_315796 [Ustulina deusta]
MNKRNEPCEVLDGYKFNDAESYWKKQHGLDHVVRQGEDDSAHQTEQQWLSWWYIRRWTIEAPGAKKDTLDKHYFDLNTVQRPLPEGRKRSLKELLKENYSGVGKKVTEILEKQIRPHGRRLEDRHQAWARENLTEEWEPQGRDSEGSLELELDKDIQDREQEEERLGREQGRAPSIGPQIDGMRFRRQELEGLRTGRVGGRTRSIG